MGETFKKVLKWFAIAFVIIAVLQVLENGVGFVEGIKLIQATIVLAFLYMILKLFGIVGK